MENKTEFIKFRVTKNEKKRIIDKAKKEGFTSTSAFIKESTKRYVSLNIDMSEYNKLTNETKKIGRNINTLIRDIRTSKYFTAEDMKKIEAKIDNLELLLVEGREELDDLEKTFIKLSADELEQIIESNKLNKPLELIYDNLVDMIKQNLLDIIKIMEGEGWKTQYQEVIYIFIYSLLPDVYTIEEIEKINDEIYKYTLKINNYLLNPKNKYTKKHFEELQKIIEGNEKYLD